MNNIGEDTWLPSLQRETHKTSPKRKSVNQNLMKKSPTLLISRPPMYTREPMKEYFIIHSVMSHLYTYLQTNLYHSLKY